MIRISEDYLISVESCEYCLRLDKHKQDKNGNDITEILGHYTSFENALDGARKEMIRVKLVDGEYTLKTALESVKEVNHKFTTIVEYVMENNKKSETI